MAHRDLALYGVHALFWVAFGLARSIAGRSDAAAATGTADPPAIAGETQTAPFSRALLVFHMVGFGIMYFGVGQAVIPGRVPEWLPGQRLLGTLVIASGAGLAAWAVLHFRSWRFRAQLERGHELATGGPFALVRHPIYAALDLLALGTALWVPTAIVWAGFLLMAVGSDLRARTEERLLKQAFGETYRAYCQRTRRFIPGVY
jgi:protein-S-isoprenylcysteine O-methyltransferase Ste14